MKRIELPTWARRPNIWMRNIRLADFYLIQEYRDSLIEVVHDEVQLYLNTDELCFDGDEDGFPNRARMTGEYYISDESYAAEVNPARFELCVSCHCLEHPFHPNQTDFDYLGLDVWVTCNPSDWSFRIAGNTCSSSI